MATEKVSVSLDPDLLAEARKNIGSGSLSAYINEGLAARVRQDRQRKYMQEWEKEFGPIPEDTREETRALWPD